MRAVSSAYYFAFDVHHIGHHSTITAGLQSNQATMQDEMSMRLESLDEWVVDDHKTISYRWLANELRISTQDAKR